MQGGVGLMHKEKNSWDPLFMTGESKEQNGGTYLMLAVSLRLDFDSEAGATFHTSS